MATVRRFTGWHMTAILVSFFAVVIVVNLFMARAAVGTFGGTVVDNSYVAGQKFDSWAQQAKAQQALGWTVAAKLDDKRRLMLTVADKAGLASGFSAQGLAEHPLGRETPRPLSFAVQPDGRLLADKALPAGRWTVKLSITRGMDTLRRIETMGGTAQ